MARASAAAAMRIGYIGLGVLGMPMAKRLLQQGFSVTAFDVRQAALEEFINAGGLAAATCRDVAAASDVVISMVRDVPQTEAVLFGSKGACDGLQPHSTVLLTSTLSPAYCRDVYARCRANRVHVIDAPVTGTSTVRQAETGEVTLMVGGDADAIDRCRPVFDALSRHVFHIGGIGQGQSAKLVTILATLAFETATYEALNLGVKAGSDLPTLVDVLSQSTGYNWWIRAWDFRMDIADRARRQYQAVTAPTPSIGEKDRLLAIGLGDELGAPTPVLEFVHALNAQSTYPAYFGEYAHLVAQRMSRPAAE